MLFLGFTFLQRGAHAVKSPRNLGNFVAALRLKRISEITAFEGTHAFDQVCERTRESVRNQESEQGACQDADTSETEQRVVQMFKECGCLIVGFQDCQASGWRRAGR